MKKYCVIDIETRGLDARQSAFIFGCLYADNGNYKKVFHNVTEMRNFLLSPKNPFEYIYAHNGEFDFTSIFGNIITELDNKALFVGSMFISAKSCGKTFANSLPILKSSAEDLGRNLGIEKLVLDDKFKRGDKEIIVTDIDIEYCYRDCEIIYIFLEKVFSYTKKIKPTIASFAMEIFRKEFLRRQLFKNEHHELFRNSYYGGRVECFRFGKISPVYKYDINSLYPHVCINMKFPDFNKIKQGKNKNKKYFQDIILKNYEGCVHATIEHKQNFVGVLPYRVEKNKELVFPCGIFSGWWNFNELRYAISTGLVDIKVVKEYVFAPRIIFTELREYMLHFYKMKETTEGAEKMLNKFLLNALTGKFAQRNYGEKTYFKDFTDGIKFIKSLPPMFEYKCHHFSEDRNDMFVEVFNPFKESQSTWNIPTISSYITSEARVKMLPHFLANQNYLCYTDTDSLAMTRPLNKKYISDNILGFFKKEHDTEMTIIGNKHYDSVVKGQKITHIKGVGKNYKQEGNAFTFTKMIRTKEGIRGEKETGMFVEVVKNLTNNYTKRKVLKNNKTQSLTIK